VTGAYLKLQAALCNLPDDFKVMLLPATTRVRVGSTTVAGHGWECRVVETADSHLFVSAVEADPRGAVIAALRRVPEAALDWGYY